MNQRLLDWQETVRGRAVSVVLEDTDYTSPHRYVLLVLHEGASPERTLTRGECNSKKISSFLLILTACYPP